jgi:3',5'-cyclic AMP phosphodiesterase CpdA
VNLPTPLRPARIAVTADLHLDFGGHLTSVEAVTNLARDIAKAEPDAIVLAGDLAHGFEAFDKCVALFAKLGVPVAVLAGNHDLWRDHRLGLGSEDLWGGKLRAAVEHHGAVWLEKKTLRVRDVGVVGSIGWYDYSAVDPAIRASDEQLAAFKATVNRDAHEMDWARDDRSFAAKVGAAFLKRLHTVNARKGVRAVVAVTHVPVLEEQIARKPGNVAWGASNAYFGNLTLGRQIMKCPKLAAVVSGHTHVARQADVPRPGLGPVRTWVIGSDYGEPVFVMIEV